MFLYFVSSVDTKTNGIAMQLMDRFHDSILVGKENYFPSKFKARFNFQSDFPFRTTK